MMQEFGTSDASGAADLSAGALVGVAPVAAVFENPAVGRLASEVGVRRPHRSSVACAFGARPKELIAAVDRGATGATAAKTCRPARSVHRGRRGAAPTMWRAPRKTDSENVVRASRRDASRTLAPSAAVGHTPLDKG
jgi:hypothetical protein